MTMSDQVAYVAEEWEAMRVHINAVELLTNCVRGCLFGRLQARKIVSVD